MIPGRHKDEWWLLTLLDALVGDFIVWICALGILGLAYLIIYFEG